MRSLCDEYDGTLTRHFEAHLGRFGDWLFRLAQDGPWKLALAIAEKEKDGGERPDVKGVEGIFWWDGDLRFLRRLQQNKQQLVEAFDQIATIVDYHDTTRPR